MNYETYEVRVYANGDKCWYLNGKLHRTDGPAVEYADGTKRWYKNGQRHRTDGPAIEYADGIRYWYLNDQYYTEAEFKKQINLITCAGKLVTIDGKQYRLTEV
jgi:hypothetical protein